MAAQLTDEAPFRRPENSSKDVVPGLPHQLEQPGHVPLGGRLLRQHRVPGIVAKFERVEPSRLQGALDLPIDERTQTRLEQVERLADSFVVCYRHSSQPLVKMLNFDIFQYSSRFSVARSLAIVALLKRFRRISSYRSLADWSIAAATPVFCAESSPMTGSRTSAANTNPPSRFLSHC